MASGRRLFYFIVFVGWSTSNIFSQYAEADWESRDEWMNVPALMELLAIDTGDYVADIGCHEGYFSFHLSRTVGPKGKVYAVDVEERRLEALTEHMATRNISNIQAVLGDYDDPKLPDNRLDAVMVMDTYHEIDSYEVVLAHIRKALKPDGRLVLIEKLKEHKRGKSRKEQVQAHTLSSKYVKKELKIAGFEVKEYIDDFGHWKNESDKQIWVLVAIPKN